MTTARWDVMELGSGRHSFEFIPSTGLELTAKWAEARLSLDGAAVLRWHFQPKPPEGEASLPHAADPTASAAHRSAPPTMLRLT
jgi:hypothetical protein